MLITWKNCWYIAGTSNENKGAFWTSITLSLLTYSSTQGNVIKLKVIVSFIIFLSSKQPLHTLVNCRLVGQAYKISTWYPIFFSNKKNNLEVITYTYLSQHIIQWIWYYKILNSGRPILLLWMTSHITVQYYDFCKLSWYIKFGKLFFFYIEHNITVW